MVPKKGCTDLPPGGGPMRPKCVVRVRLLPPRGKCAAHVCGYTDTYDAYERGQHLFAQCTLGLMTRTTDLCGLMYIFL